MNNDGERNHEKETSKLSVSQNLKQNAEGAPFILPHFAFIIHLAERVGFEPTRLTPIRFRIGRTRPDYATSPACKIITEAVGKFP